MAEFDLVEDSVAYSSLTFWRAVRLRDDSVISAVLHHPASVAWNGVFGGPLLDAISNHNVALVECLLQLPQLQLLPQERHDLFSYVAATGNCAVMSALLRPEHARFLPPLGKKPRAGVTNDVFAAWGAGVGAYIQGLERAVRHGHGDMVRKLLLARRPGAVQGRGGAAAAGVRQAPPLVPLDTSTMKRLYFLACSEGHVRIATLLAKTQGVPRLQFAPSAEQAAADGFVREAVAATTVDQLRALTQRHQPSAARYEMAFLWACATNSPAVASFMQLITASPHRDMWGAVCDGFYILASTSKANASLLADYIEGTGRKARAAAEAGLGQAIQVEDSDDSDATEIVHSQSAADAEAARRTLALGESDDSDATEIVYGHSEADAEAARLALTSGDSDDTVIGAGHGAGPAGAQAAHAYDLSDLHGSDSDTDTDSSASLLRHVGPSQGQGQAALGQSAPASGAGVAASALAANPVQPFMSAFGPGDSYSYSDEDSDDGGSVVDETDLHPYDAALYRRDPDAILAALEHVIAQGDMDSISQRAWKETFYVALENGWSRLFGFALVNLPRTVLFEGATQTSLRYAIDLGHANTGMILISARMVNPEVVVQMGRTHMPGFLKETTEQSLRRTTPAYIVAGARAPAAGLG